MRQPLTGEPPAYEQAFGDFVRAAGRWRDVSPEQLVSRWRRFVEECLAGYPGRAEDYFNDLTARGALARAMGDPFLNRFQEMAELKQEVAEIDVLLQPQMRPDVFTRFADDRWWERGVIRSVGHRLVVDLRDGYGVIIDEFRA
jgi:hypothetical protein